MRLEQEGKCLSVTLEDGDSREWRLAAYVAVYETIESVLALVLQSLSLRACVKCVPCDQRKDVNRSARQTDEH